MSEVIILKNDDLEVGIAPNCGASIVYMQSIRGTPFEFLRHGSASSLEKRDANSMGMFPMLPFTHRIKGGSFIYWGILRKVPLNFSKSSDPIHGDGWKAIWSMLEKTPSSVVLTFSHSKEKKGYPFSYTAKIQYSLETSSLKTEISIKNDSSLPMPVGMGIHPFFNKTPDMMLRFNNKNVWSHLSDPIDKPYPTPESWSFKELKKIKNMEFDTCFGGFDGEAQIVWPKVKKSIIMTTDEKFRHTVLFSPPRKGFICLEPTTMANNGFNLAANGLLGTGIQSIGPHETLVGRIRLETRDL